MCRTICKTLFRMVGFCVICLSVFAVDFCRNFRDQMGVYVTDKRFLNNTKNLSIVVHHTASDNPFTIDEINRYHRDSCGWESGFAYHFFVTDSVVYRVHCDTARTIHAGNQYYNNNAIAVCLAGNFENRQPNIMELKNLFETLIFLQIKHQIPFNRVHSHGAISDCKTACCGKYLKFYLNKIYDYE